MTYGGDASEIDRSRDLCEQVDAGRDVEERLRPAAASTDAAVLEVPGREPVCAQVDAQIDHERAVVLRAPVPAVKYNGDGKRPGAGGEEKLPDLARVGAVGVRGADHAPGRIRTCGLALRRRALYPLSYGRGEKPVYARAMDVEARIVRLRLAETFVIAREAAEYADVVHVSLTHEGVTGYGEAAPVDHYGESVQSAVEFVEQHWRIVGDDPFALEDIGERLASIPGEHAAKSALDAALHDLQGKLLGIPVFRLLGLPRTGPPTSWTIWLGDPDDMARRAEKAGETYRRLKLKLGGGDGLDVERVRAVRAVTDLPLMVDVNEWWSLEEALDALPQLAQIGIEYCEQPLRAGDEGGPLLKSRSPVPIYVDEDCHTLADIESCAAIAHGINIKLAKSGGIREATRMAHAARALRMGVMLGCMLESGLGIAAGCCVAPLCDHVDLDGNLLLRTDPWPGVELRDGVQVPSPAPGLGLGPA
jgi:L-Ala-D/L-Glu epimerase / N-acetyl-D-glutamate racemase